MRNEKPGGSNKGGNKGGKRNLGKDKFGNYLGWIPEIDIDNKIKEIDSATKIGVKIEHLTDSSIYAEMVPPAKMSTGGPSDVGENARFHIYVAGKKREGSYTRNQVKNIFKVGKTPSHG